MKALNLLDEQIISLNNASKFLSKEEYENFVSIPPDERNTLLKDLLEKPISKFTAVNDLFFRVKWAELIEKNHGQQPISILEIASGDADMIPQSLARSNPKSTYITANMNKALNESLLKKTIDLSMEIKLIDDDAANINNYMVKNTIDIIAFQHGVNDVLQCILCNKYNVDTTYVDWMKILPKMIELLNKEINEGSFEQSVKQPFLTMIKTLVPLLKENGIIAINHYMFQLDLDWGYPKNLFENLVPIIRDWFKETEIYEEVLFDGFEKQWWIFLKHKK